jgi:hypothetical protein
MKNGKQTGNGTLGLIVFFASRIFTGWLAGFVRGAPGLARSPSLRARLAASALPLPARHRCLLRARTTMSVAQPHPIWSRGLPLWQLAAWAHMLWGS